MAGTATADLSSAAGAVPIVRDTVSVLGPDAVAYLQGQLSQDIEALAVGASAPSFLLQPTGKVDAWLRVTRTADDALLLDVDAGWGEAVAARLRRFLLRTKADLAPGRWSGLALRGPGAVAAADAAGAELPDGAVRADAPWPGVEAIDLLGPEPGIEVELETATAADLEALRVAIGVPAMGAEVREGTIPAELGQWAVDASASFTKGCYTGQELVARIDSRGGNVPHPVRGLRLAAAVEAGAPVVAGGTELGRTTSVALHPRLGPIALAVLARAAGPGTAVEVAGVAGSVVELPQR